MTLSIVIPTLREASEIGPCLRHLRAVAPEVEVVVVDGGSDDGTVALAREEGVPVLEGAGTGRARQMNAGAAATSGELLLFLHVDTRLPVDAVSLVEETLHDPGVSVGAFAFRLNGRRPIYRLMDWATNVRGRVFGLPYGDQALFMRRGSFEALGGYGPLRVMEDLDLVSRAAALGRIAVLDTPAVTSARKYEEQGVFRVAARHLGMAVRYKLGWRPGLPE